MKQQLMQAAYDSVFGSQAYFGKSAPKIQHLRPDSLAMLLSLANIGAHAKVTHYLLMPAFTLCATALQY